jgi:Asp-tRNA(Asn)/Glu-tRNA(Gln) amidotransferase A subunit family amidase
VGIIAKDVELTSKVFDVMMSRKSVGGVGGTQCHIGSGRVGVLQDMFLPPLSSDLSRALKLLNGETVTEAVSLAELGRQKSTSTYEFKSDVEEYFRNRGHAEITMQLVVETTRELCATPTCETISRKIESKLATDGTLPPHNKQAWDRLKRTTQKLLEKFDVLVYPSFTVSPSLLTRSRQAFCPANRLAASTGLPALSVPIGLGSHGFPVGLELLANEGNECVLFDVAKRLI